MDVEWDGDTPRPAHGPKSPSEQARTSKGWTRDPDVAEKANMAMRLRARGWTYQDIADELGYANRAAAKNLIDRAYADNARPAVEALRAAMNDQLEELYAKAMKVAEARHLKVVGGTVVFNPETGSLMEDDAPVLRAIDTGLRVHERMAKLNGLDEPTRVQAQVQDVRVTVDGAEDV